MDYNPKKVLQNLATINCIKLTRQILMQVDLNLDLTNIKNCSNLKFRRLNISHSQGI